MDCQRQGTDCNQIKVMNALLKLENEIGYAHKTILLYDQFGDRQQDEIHLNYLNVIGQTLLDKDIQVQVQKEVDDQTIIYRYGISSEQRLSHSINRKVFEVQEGEGDKQEVLDNIVIYEKEIQIDGETIKMRVVILPIQKKMINLDSLREEALNWQAEQQKRNAQMKKLSGEAHIKFKKQSEDIQKQNFKKRCLTAADKQEKAFRIKAIERLIFEKTQKISVCCFADLTNRRYTNLDSFIKQFSSLFRVSHDFIPQFVLHKYSPEARNSNVNKQVGREEVSTIFSLIKGKFGVHKFDCYDEKYYFSPKKVGTKFFENLQTSEDKAILHVIQEYMSNWSRIALETASAFTSVFKHASSIMQNDTAISISEDPNSSMASLNSSKDIEASSSFNDIFEKYISKSLWLPDKAELTNEYSDRMSDISIQKGYPLISESIQPLTFIHFFYKIGMEIFENIAKVDMETKGDTIKLLQVWKKGLREIYSLINSENGTFLQRKESVEFVCPDMKRFLNFLLFTFDAVEKIKEITNRDLPLVAELKSVLEKLKMRKEKVLSFITKNSENLLKKKQPIHYYDILIKIIKENANNQVEKDLEYIFLMIHIRKADLISKSYNYDHEKVVEAIRSYALAIIQIPNLNENKRKVINIVEIYDKMARLLKILGHYQQAAEIFIKLKDFDEANKCFKIILIQLSSRDKASKLIAWGKLFEADFEYDLALSYYRKAFSQGKTLENKKQAIQCKLDCVEKMSKGPEKAELLMFTNFLEDSGDLETFTSKIDLSVLLLKVKQNILWDKKSSCSVIMCDDEDIQPLKMPVSC